jgi:GTPase SAR1 family protein
MKLTSRSLLSSLITHIPKDEAEIDLNDLQLSITVMGTSKVGKTSKLTSSIKKRFNFKLYEWFEKTKNKPKVNMEKDYNPTIFERYSTLYKVKEIDSVLDLSIYDTGGDQTGVFSLENFWDQWIVESDGIVLVYDSNDLESLKSLKKITTAIYKIKSRNFISSPKTPAFPLVLGFF